MSIVLNENAWAETMIRESSLGKKPSETLRRVARFYMDTYNLNQSAARKRLDLFLLQCDPTASLPKWSDTLDWAAKRAAKYPAICIDAIPITKTEMKQIESLQGKQLQRLAFTLLCLAKYWNTVNDENDGWVNSKDTEIVRMANINTSLKRQNEMFRELSALGMICFSRRVDNINVRVCFMEEGAEAMRITDLRNLGYQWLMHHGEPYFACQRCGLATRMNDAQNRRRQKYCPECAATIRMQQSIQSAMRCRAGSPENVGN